MPVSTRVHRWFIELFWPYHNEVQSNATEYKLAVQSQCVNSNGIKYRNWRIIFNGPITQCPFSKELVVHYGEVILANPYISFLV